MVQNHPDYLLLISSLRALYSFSDNHTFQPMFLVDSNGIIFVLELRHNDLNFSYQPGLHSIH